MKVWKNYKTLHESMPSLFRRKCWNTCNECKQKWSETETEFVHMIQPGGKVRFICDNCLIILIN